MKVIYILVITAGVQTGRETKVESTVTAHATAESCYKFRAKVDEKLAGKYTALHTKCVQAEVKP